MQSGPSIHVIDGDEIVRRALAVTLANAGMQVRTYVSAAVFYNALSAIHDGCIVADLDLRDGSGFDLLRELKRRDILLPVILTSARATVPLAVEVMRAGASDFLEKPLEETALLTAASSAMERHRAEIHESGDRSKILARLETLSARERQVLEELIAGHPNKIIAYHLGISVRTIELYRSNVMAKMQAASLSDLIRMAMAGGIPVAQKQAS